MAFLLQGQPSLILLPESQLFIDQATTSQRKEVSLLTELKRRNIRFWESEKEKISSYWIGHFIS